MKSSTRSALTSAFLVALSATACTAASSPPGEGGDGEESALGATQSAVGVIPIGGIPPILIDPGPPPVKPQSFLAPATWANSMVYNDGWTGAYPRQLADLNGDGKKDVVGFGKDGVWLARSLGTSFDVRYVLADFGESSGWSTSRHERLIGDINGDGKDDIVGFGNAGVYVTTSTATGFTPVSWVIADFGYDSGWRVESHERLLADVDGDGKQDIVAYGNDGVWIARSTGSGFTPPSYVLARFGSSQGFNKVRHVRTAADVNGDGKADLVVFADDGVYTALSTGAGFATPVKVVNGLGYDDAWRVESHPRMLVDVNRDGRKDIVAFGTDGVWVARSNGAGFASPTYEVAQFGTAQGFGGQAARPRFVADLNGDGYVDIAGSGPQSVWRSLGGPTGFAAAESVLNDFSGSEFMGSGSKPVMAGDVDGDGKADLVGFNTYVIEVARSTDVPPPAPPVAPSNLRTTLVGSSQIAIAWNDNSSDEIRFRVQYRRAPSTTYTSTTVIPNTTTLSLSGLTPSTQYCFKVSAEGQFNASSPSSVLCVTTSASSGGGGGGGGSDPPSETLCGTGLGVCRAGYHEAEFFYSSSCPGRIVTIDNATTCVRDSSVFTGCGILSCPAGHHAVSFVFQAQCDLSSNIPSTDDNATTCQADSTSFTACGGCPSGYGRTETFGSPACTPYNTYICNKL